MTLRASERAFYYSDVLVSRNLDEAGNPFVRQRPA